MKEFESFGELNIGNDLLKKAQNDFISSSVNDKEIIYTIQKFYKDNKYILDPHTAVGVCTAEKHKFNTPIICLACAHPSKFNNTIKNALGFEQEIPEELAILNDLETKFKSVPPDEEKIKSIIVETINYNTPNHNTKKIESKK